MVQLMGKLTFAQVLPAALQFTAMVLVLLALTGPRPFSGTDVALFRIQAEMPTPSNTSSTINSTMGGVNSTSSLLPSSSVPNATAISTSSLAIVTPSTVAVPTTSEPPALTTTPAPPAPPTLPGVATVPPPGAPAVSAAVASSIPPPTSAPPSTVPVIRRRSPVDPPRPLAEREAVNVTSSSLGGATLRPLIAEASKLELILGPLGSCFVSTLGKKQCTGSSLRPSFDSTGLSSSDVGFSTIGLPESLDKTPALLLASLSILILSAVSHIPWLLASANPPRFAHLLDSGPRQRYYARAQSLMVWLVIASFLILFGAGVSLRIVFAKALTAFNASNSSLGRTLPMEATVSGKGKDVTLVAKLGVGFSLIWAAVACSLVSIILERKRLRRAQALTEAKGDLEARFGREALEKAGVASRFETPKTAETGLTTWPGPSPSDSTSKDTLTTIYVPESNKPYYSSFAKASSTPHFASPSEPASAALSGALPDYSSRSAKTERFVSRSASRSEKAHHHHHLLHGYSSSAGGSGGGGGRSYESSVMLASPQPQYPHQPPPAQTKHAIPAYRAASPGSLSAYDYYMGGGSGEAPPGSSASDLEMTSSPRGLENIRRGGQDDRFDGEEKGSLWRKKPKRHATDDGALTSSPPSSTSTRGNGIGRGKGLNLTRAASEKGHYWTYGGGKRVESEYEASEVSHGGISCPSIASSHTLCVATPPPSTLLKNASHKHAPSASDLFSRDEPSQTPSATTDGQPTLTTLLLSTELTRKREIQRAMYLQHAQSEEERERKREMESREMMRWREEMERRCRVRDAE